MARILGSTNRDSNYEVRVRKPLDARSIVQTYADLTTESNWIASNGTPVAYNGMIVAVWLDPDPTLNGIYFLHDSTVTTLKAVPKTTEAANWHRLGGVENLPGLTDQLKAIQEDLETVKNDVEDLQDSATVVKDTKSAFPEIGVPGKIYVATKEAMTYVWYNNDYLPVGDGGDNSEIQIISGGGPTA